MKSKQHIFQMHKLDYVVQHFPTNLRHTKKFIIYIKNSLFFEPDARVTDCLSCWYMWVYLKGSCHIYTNYTWKKGTFVLITTIYLKIWKNFFIWEKKVKYTWLEHRQTLKSWLWRNWNWKLKLKVKIEIVNWN